MSEQTSTGDRVYTHSVCTDSVCVSKPAPKRSGAGAGKHGLDGRAANTAVLPQVNSRLSVLLLLLLLCANLHTQTYTSCHECVQSVGTLEVA